MPDAPPRGFNPAELDRAALRAFWDVYVLHREAVDAEMRDKVMDIPIFAALAANADPAEMERQRLEGWELQRAAFEDDRWDAYVANLAVQGRIFARMGIALADWFRLLDPYRTVLIDRMLTDLSGDPAGLRRALRGTELFIDLAMAGIGEAYVAEKESLVRKAEALRDLYDQLFAQNPLGLVILRRSVAGEFDPIAANQAASDMDLYRVRAMDLSRPAQWEIEGEGGTTLEARCFSLDDAHMGLIVENVTEKRRMVQQLQWSVAELERSNRDLDNFAYVASHDLKAPLRDIDNLAKWIVADAFDSLPPASQRHLSRLRERMQRMEQLLDDLLQYSRAGRVMGEPVALDLNDVLAAVLRGMTIRDGFEISVPVPLPAVRTPRAPIEQVLRNLIGNALKHHDGTTGRVVITWTDQGAFLEIAVSDDGPGIPPAFSERVFQMFQTLRPRDEVEGSGMGLAIVRKVVETFGGRAWVDRAEGRGATFRFTWPRDARAQSVPQPPSQGAARG